MSDELILNVSFDNQTVTDLTGNWTLDGTPNVTYEQISGGSGYSLVTGTLGTPPILVAVDQEAIYNEYTIDFNLYVKPSYTDTGWFSLFSLDAGMNYSGDYMVRVYNGLTISVKVGGSSSEVTIDSPTSRWIHITIISEYNSDTGDYTAYLYVDSVLRTYQQGTRLNGSPFAIGKKLVLFNRGGSSFYLPNTPGLAMDGLTVIAGIHVPNQTPAISLPNLSRVFQNFCTWLSSQLSAVAKSGSYNDLSDKPTISTVNDGTLTIQKNGTNVATFTANQSTAATANITVPTAVSELTNDSGYLTASSNLDASKLTSGTVDIERLPQGALERLIKVANEAARYALTTADVQLGDTVQQLDTGIMYVVTDTDHLDSAAGYTEYTAGTAASVPWSGVTGKPTFAAVATSGAYSDLTGTPALAAVATSGAYSDLTGTPTIPTVNNATLTIQKNGANVQTFTANQSTNATANITVPTKTSDLTNDSGFITSDNTKIPLAGSNQISGDLIPSTDGTVNLGSSTAQWNNAYIKSLTINGVACGDILTHNVSEFVDVSSNQIIGGVKTFTNEVTMFGRDINLMSRLHYGKNSNPSSNTWQYLYFRGNTATEGYTNAWYSGYIEQYVDTTGSARGRWVVRDTSENAITIDLYVDGNNKQVRPLENNTVDLGTSTNKWKSFNDINPGALSLPRSSDSSINIDTTNWDLTCSNKLLGSFTPTADGWLMLQVNNSGSNEVNLWIIGGGDLKINNKSTLNTVNNDNFNMITIPVRKNTTYNIYGNASEYVAGRSIAYCRFMPCQGNV